MRLTSRLKAAISAAAILYAAPYVVRRVIELNTDALLEKIGLGKIISDALPPQIPEPVMSFWTDYVIPSLSFIMGPFGLGFVVAAVLFSLPDIPIARRWLDRRRTGSTSAQEWRPEGLHVSWMTVNAKRLYTDYYIEIAVHGFNATGASISIGDATGNMRFRETIDTPAENGMEMPVPKVLHDRTPTKGIANLTQIFLVVEQRVPSDIVERIRTQMAAGKRVRLDINSVMISVVQDGAKEHSTCLPIWNSVSLHQSADQINMMPVYDAQGALTVNA